MSASTPPPEPSRRAAHSVLQVLGERIDVAPRVLLRDSGAESQPEPFVDARAARDFVPQGRGNYEVHGEIARGGMGQILKARDTDLGREVAIKVLDPALAEQPFVLRRFIEEAQIGGQLQHPGIVPVYELGTMSDERPYFAMKLVKGRTLSALFAQRKDPADERHEHLAIFESVCQTVAYAHSKGVIHRDLKPENVMVGAFGEVLVVDWGLAKVLGQGGVSDEERAHSSQRSIIETVRSGPGSSGTDSIVGSVMGTPAYMPPEQARGDVERLDERSDVFSLGAILCELLTGLPPYVEREGERVVVQAAQARLDPAIERIAQCDADEELKRLCLECLTAAPSARPRDAQEVARRVHEHLASLEEKARAAELAAVEARVGAAGERRARRLTLALALAVIVALVAAGGGIYWTEAQRRERASGVRRVLDESQSRVVALQQEERFDEALQVARASLAAFDQAGVDDDGLRAVAQRSVALAGERVEQARAQEEHRRRNAELVARLEDIRAEQFDVFLSGRFGDLDRSFHEAFLAYGVDLSGEEFVSAYETLRDSGIAAEVVPALDDWALARRAAAREPTPEAEKLTMLAIDLDHDELHTRVREAILRADGDELLGFTGGPLELELDPAMLWTVGSALWELGHRTVVRAALDRSCRRYRHEFLLHLVMGSLYRDARRFDRALVVLQTAATLRPASATAQLQLGMTLVDLGEHAAAAPVLREALRLRPLSEDAAQFLVWTLWALGEIDEAIVQLEAARQAASIRVEALDTLALRCQSGSGSVEELLAKLEGAPDQGAGVFVFTVATLLERGPATESSLRRARELGQKAAATQPSLPEAWLAWVDALVRSGEPAEALKQLERAQAQCPPGGRADIEFEFARAEAQHLLGDAASARAAFERAERGAQLRVQNREADWARSRLVQRRERTARALGR